MRWKKRKHAIIAINPENMVPREVIQTQKEKCHLYQLPQERQAVQSHRGGKQDGGEHGGLGGGGAKEKVFGNSSDGCSLVSSPSVTGWNSKMS